MKLQGSSKIFLLLFVLVVLLTEFLMHRERLTKEVVEVSTEREITSCEMPADPLEYGFCDGQRKALVISGLNVTVHLFEFSIVENTESNSVDAQILAFVQDIYLPIVRVHSFGTMSNKTENMTFTGIVGTHTLEFRQLEPYFRSGMLLSTNLGTRTEFVSKYSEKLEIILKASFGSELFNEEITLSTCKQPPRKKYNMVSVQKPVYGDSIKLEHVYEWIAHHTNIGVQHFIIYSRNENYPPQIQRLIDAEVVTWKYFPKFGNFSWHNMDQDISYTHCAMQNRYNINWLLVHDIDEFLVSHGVSLPWALQNWKCEPAIEITRTTFTSDNNASVEPFQFQQYIERESYDFWDLPKTLVQPRFVWWVGAHYSNAKGYYGLRYGLQHQKETEKPLLAPAPNQIRWNHYIKMTARRNMKLYVPVTDKAALFYVPYLNETYANVVECANGDNSKCKELKNVEPVYMPAVEQPVQWKWIPP